MGFLCLTIIAMEKKCFTIELIYPSGTGYDTAIKSMPKEVTLLDYAKEVLRPILIGCPVKHIFTFLALEDSEDISISFQQIRIL